MCSAPGFLDSGVTVFASTRPRPARRGRVAPARGFALAVLEGQHINKMKDRDGHAMHDSYLVTKLAREYPWIKSVYEKTSNYIHLSNTHIFSMSVRRNHEDRSGHRLAIGPRDKDIPDDIYLQAITTFRDSTGILARYIERWIFTKANPEKISAMKTPCDNT